MRIVHIENLCKSYGDVLAVDGLCLAIEKGTIMGLIGPNGAGKTTTIRIALGLLKPDKGRVEVFGQDPWDNPDIRSRIGVVYEKANFPGSNTVIQYLQRTGRIFGLRHSIVLETLEKVGLSEARSRQIRALSAGMLQRFAIAHALIHQPELVIADEPTSNLDPQARSELLDLILELHLRHKTTFLISSHILPELNRICESVAIVNNGKVWAQGDFLQLCESFGVTSTRVSTDKPEALAKALRGVGYVRTAKADTRGVAVSILGDNIEQLYEDILALAKNVGATVLGIETGTASLEELFRFAVRRKESEAGGGRNDNT